MASMETENTKDHSWKSHKQDNEVLSQHVDTIRVARKELYQEINMNVFWQNRSVLSYRANSLETKKNLHCKPYFV